MIDFRHRYDDTGTRWPAAWPEAILVVALTVGVAFIANHFISHSSLSLLFLTGVLIVSVRTGLGPSLLASVLSFLAYNFFFTLPYYTFEVADDSDVVTLVFYLIMAAITGNLAARMHREVAERRASLQRISNLYDFSRRMSSAVATDEVLESLADHLCKSLGRPVRVMIATGEGTPVVRAAAGDAGGPPDTAVAAAWSSEDKGMIAAGEWSFIKLLTNNAPPGMVAIAGEADEDEQVNLARSLCDQAALAMDRTQLGADLEQVRLISETEQLRSALLSSVSHDLRTPLASIIGSTTSLLEYGKSISEGDRRELLEMVVDEAQRLDRHIQNLLDMSRLGQGSLSLQRDWVDLHDIVSSSLDRLRGALKEIPVDIHIEDDVPLLWVHGVLIEQALVNLLDNALRFSPESGHIAVTARLVDTGLMIEVCDQGPGVPENEREKIFDMFYTARQGDRGRRQGTGLGLAICRGMIGAHGGTVTAHDGRDGRGTCMRIALPVLEPAEDNA